MCVVCIPMWAFGSPLVQILIQRVNINSSVSIFQWNYFHFFFFLPGFCDFLCRKRI